MTTVDETPPEERSPYDVRSRLDFLCSYPKSGNTWVRLLLAAYMGKTPYRVELAADYGQLLYGAVSPVPVEKMTWGQQVQCRGAALYHIAAERLEDPMILKSHNAYGAFAGVPLFSPQWTRKVVYVVRDPRDVLPSFAHHHGYEMGKAAEVMAETSARLPGLDRGAQHISSWSQHVLSWVQARETLDVLFVRYEDMHEDTARELTRIVDHLGYVDAVEPELVDYAVEAASFDRQKQKEQEEGFPEASDEGEFFRKGEAGGWREEVPPELVEKIERDHGKAMQALGYEQEMVTV